MGYVTSVLGLQVRSRRNARNAARSLSLRRSVDASRAKAVVRRSSPRLGHREADSSPADQTVSTEGDGDHPARSAARTEDGSMDFAATTVRLDDGRVLHVRPIRPDDTDDLIAMHRRLSTTTVARRFFVPLPELPRAQAERFTHVDGVDRVALVAVAEPRDLVAVVRYDRLPGTTDAEVAIVVRDDHQHHQLGTQLLRLLSAHAQRQGITRFVADVLSDNSAMFKAFRDAELIGVPDYDHGVAHLLLPLPAGPPLELPG